MKGFMDNYFAEDSFRPYGDAEREQMKQNMWDLATYAAAATPVGRVAVPTVVGLGKASVGFLAPDIAANIAGHYYGPDAQRAIDTVGYFNSNPLARVGNRILDTINPDYLSWIKNNVRFNSNAVAKAINSDIKR